MSLRYTFRHLFYGGKIQKERLYKILEDLDAANGGESEDIEDLESDVANIKEAIGDETGGLIKDVADVQDVIGDESDATSILGRLKALEDAE